MDWIRSRTYSELARPPQVTLPGRFASGQQNRGETPTEWVRRAGAVVKAACSISANPYYSVQRFYRVSEAKDAPDRALPSLRFGHQERLHPVLKSQWFRPLIRPDFSLRLFKLTRCAPGLGLPRRLYLDAAGRRAPSRRGGRPRHCQSGRNLPRGNRTVVPRDFLNGVLCIQSDTATNAVIGSPIPVGPVTRQPRREARSRAPYSKRVYTGRARSPVRRAPLCPFFGS